MPDVRRVRRPRTRQYCRSGEARREESAHMVNDD
jgi:hypothetical protein